MKAKTTRAKNLKLETSKREEKLKMAQEKEQKNCCTYMLFQGVGDSKIIKNTENKKILKTIYVPNKIVNLVVK